MPLRRIGLQANRDEERPWVRVGCADPRWEGGRSEHKGIYADRLHLHLGIGTPYSNPGTLLIPVGLKAYPAKGMNSWAGTSITAW